MVAIRQFRNRVAGVLIALMLATFLTPTARAREITLLDVTVRDTGTSVGIEFVTSAPVVAKVEELDYPPRLSVTLPGVVPSSDVPRVLEIHRGEVLRVRILVFTAPVAVRAVVDLAGRISHEVSNPLPNVLAIAYAVPPSPSPLPAPSLPPRPVTVAFRDAPLAEVLGAVARVCGINVLAVAPLDGKVTVEFEGIPCEEAIPIILQGTDLAFRRVGRTLVVAPREKMPEPAYIAGYQLRSADPGAMAKQLKELVKGASIYVDDSTSTLYIEGTEGQHAQVRRLLPSLDVAAPHVQIEAAVVDVGMNVLRELGLNWGISTSAGDAVTVLQAPGVKVTVGMTAVGRIQALVSEGRAHVLASPRVVTPSGQRATITLGEDFPVPSRDAEGNLTFTFRRIGVTLDILPRANRDGTVTAEVTVRVESVLELLPTPAGPVPRIATREIRLLVRVPSGETVVLGGLISSEERRAVVKVPFLGELPVVGKIFQATTVSTRESEVVFTLTPRILRQDGRT